MKQIKNGRIHYIEPQFILSTKGISAGFTTRHEGVSRPPYNSLNLGLNTNDSPHNVQGNRSLLARAFGAKLEQLLTVTQVHGTDLLVLDSPNQDVTHFLKLECDGIITNQPGIMIGIGVADCAPVLLLDPVKRVIAALHSGWKGTAAGIVHKGVGAMVNDFGSNPADMVAAIGPAIGPCCYEVDEPVRSAFSTQDGIWAHAAVEQAKGKWKLDLSAAIRLQLTAAGLQPDNIESSQQCVSCVSELFYSYRRDKGETGRHLGFIMLK
ncbi:laccase domain protein YlmD [Geobacter sp. OR-1]|uniref:peptidoglycan editing factor PgeF n=1 Tax=Geobacter sp. OR-1 TaxID=1266765 RepID=UPI000543DA50|nr:peptidoglycan editing factor PgeF [Geobacter sp. OR-1]GAM09183.1 laccase domain protein YlmD [Geobacter sp. OR-1]